MKVASLPTEGVQPGARSLERLRRWRGLMEAAEPAEQAAVRAAFDAFLRAAADQGRDETYALNVLATRHHNTRARGGRSAAAAAERVAVAAVEAAEAGWLPAPGAGRTRSERKRKAEQK